MIMARTNPQESEWQALTRKSAGLFAGHHHRVPGVDQPLPNFDPTPVICFGR